MNSEERIAGLNEEQRELLRQRLLEKRPTRSTSRGHTRLVAFIKTHTPHSNDDRPDYREFLGSSLPAYMIPSLFKEIKAVPQTTNGKVDKSALHAQLDQEAPKQSPLSSSSKTLSSKEQTLAGIWSKYLGRTDIRVTDDFFALGGDSLLAIQMIGEASRHDIEIKVSDFFNTPNIASLVEEKNTPIQAGDNRVRVEPGGSGLIYPLHPEGSLPPLFLIHEIASTVFMYRELAKYLPDDQPVFVIQQKNLLFDSMDQLADRYYEEIRKVYPSGPFHLGGYCFGGHAAYAMAKRLAGKGIPPPYIVVIDGILMNLVRYRPKYLWGFLKRQSPASILSRLSVKLRKLANRSARAIRKESGFKDEASDYYEVSGLPDEMRKMMDSNFRIQRDLRPGKYTGDMTLITTPSIYSELDPYTGWDRIVKGRITVHCIKSDHGSIMKEPSVQDTGEAIARDLLRFNSK